MNNKNTSGISCDLDTTNKFSESASSANTKVKQEDAVTLLSEMLANFDDPEATGDEEFIRLCKESSAEINKTLG